MKIDIDTKSQWKFMDRKLTFIRPTLDVELDDVVNVVAQGKVIGRYSVEKVIVKKLSGVSYYEVKKNVIPREDLIDYMGDIPPLYIGSPEDWGKTKKNFLKHYRKLYGKDVDISDKVSIVILHKWDLDLRDLVTTKQSAKSKSCLEK